MPEIRHNLEKEETNPGTQQSLAGLTYPGSSRRRYSDKEISLILKRALDLKHADRKAGKTSDERDGLLLEDLQQIAAGVGIESGYVQAAVSELDSSGISGSRFHLWGSPMVVDLERIVEGEFPESEWETLVAEIRRHFREAGLPGKVGNSLEWRSHGSELPVHIAISPRKGQTRISIIRRFDNIAMAFHLVSPFLGLSLCAALSSEMHLESLVELAISGGIMGGVFVLTRTAFGAWAGWQQRKIRGFLDRLAAMISESASPEAEKQPEMKR